MSPGHFIEVLSLVPFVVIFLVVLVQAVQRPRRVNLDIALFFGAFALATITIWVGDALNVEDNRLVSLARLIPVILLPYLLLRVVRDFADVPLWLLRGTEVVLSVLIVSVVLLSPDLPAWLTVLVAVYFVGLGIYAAVAFVKEARRSRGVTSRRMQAAAAGSAFLGFVILVAAARGLIAALDGLVIQVLLRALVIATGVSYFLAFAPPGILRRAWQEPELRGLLRRVAVLPRLPETEVIVHELEDGAAASLGSPYASIGLWDEDAGVLRFRTRGQTQEIRPGEWIAGRTFSTQTALFTENAPRDDPEHAEAYQAYEATAVLAAPITAGERRLGVLVVYAARAPIFADDDLEITQLLADQAAMILESRALIAEATRIRAREEATRLKDDFLIAAAHDLRTPLTALIGHAQLLERRALRQPDAPADLDRIRQIGSDLRRLNALITELLDASRVEHGQLLGAREPVDLVMLADAARQRHAWLRHRFVLDADEPVMGEYDRARIGQLIDNLLENAIKYSPDGGEVRMAVWNEDGEARISVTDQGVGIPADDLPHIFERFHRARNVDNPEFTGMGLGLYICRGIVEQHGGRIWVTSRPGHGTTFDVALPLARAAVSQQVLTT